MITRTTTFGGALLIMAGLFGFIAPGFMGLRLSPAHNLLFLVSGAVAIYFGLLTRQAAGRTFCIVFGAFYGLLGLAGLVAGGLNGPITIIPEALVLGTMDHVVHGILGAVFLTVGCVSETGHRQFIGAANKS
ncbi:MAG: DUF4383 domain-containing protein [Verrucomicrobia bacterium]|nr:DUF4383 domain-containing protein [Verrucomicrobiota bacterium]